MNQRRQQNMYDTNVNVNLMVENVIQIKSQIIRNVCKSVKNIIYVKKIIFENLLHVVAKEVNIKLVLLTVQWLYLTKL